MRRLRFLTALLLILSACSERIIESGNNGSGREGSIFLGLTAEQRTEAVSTKSGVELPNVDDFRVAVYRNADRMRLYNDSYANTKGREIRLNAGEYYIVAQHGDTLGCGFDKPYYMANPVVEVAGYGTSVELEAKLANVRMAVGYDETITSVYDDFYAVVKHKKYPKKQIKFVKGEDRYGYIPAGDVVFQIYVLDDLEGTPVWKYHETETFTYNPNDFVTFYVATKDGKGDITINMTVDTSVDMKESEIEIPSFTTPQEAPSIGLTGFDAAGNVHQFTEGIASPDGTMAHFVARGAVASCILTVDSDYLAGKGIPSEVDFANLTAEQDAALKAAGFEWSAGLLTSREYSYIDFSGVIENMLAEVRAAKEDVSVADFTLKVTDSVNKTAETSFGITSLGITTSLDVKDYNVWARKVYGPVATASRGDISLLKLQTSTDGTSWTDVTVSPSVSGMTKTYEYIPLNPGTKYYMRSIYNGNEACSSPVVEITAEAAAQLGNSGFEDYQLVQTTFKQDLSSDFVRNWYLPYASGETDPWWACNSMQSMPDGISSTSKNYKNFPSSGYVSDARSGSKAAMLFCVNVGWWNTSSTKPGETYEGEIWIGTADASGNRASDGHSFHSRPAKLAFYYKYAPTENRKFFVDAWIKDAAGNLIATAQETAGPAASAWTRHELAFAYTNREVKAATIFVRFSASYGDGAAETNSTFELGVDSSISAHAGCFFKIDDIELIYE